MAVLREMLDWKDTDTLTPAIFVGHGSPMNAIEQNEFSAGWARSAAKLPKPRAILCVSAHWFVPGTKVTAMPKPRTIHDFYGFPRALYEVSYPAPGAPELAEVTKSLVDLTQIELDHEWGLDHGTWSVLRVMYPDAQIPVLQLSLDSRRDGPWHAKLAAQLQALRRKGVLIVGSGNVVHNLARLDFSRPERAHDWALEFDAKVKSLVDARDIAALADYPTLGTAASLSIPTPEHYLPLLYVLGLASRNEPITHFNERCLAGSIGMRSLIVG